jgi:RNA polymerase sigma-70 factor, ECF subfamily
MKRDYRKHSDEELFDAFSRGEGEKNAAFEEIYSRYADRVYAYCLRMTLSHDDADDMFQEAFTRFFHHRFGEERVGSILSYLLTSARNMFLNARRTSNRLSPYAEEDFLTGTPPMYEREELVNMISAALELLDTTYREAFVLRFYQSLSYREMSDITGDSIAALKVRVMRAKDQLRGILAPYIQDLSKS